MKQSKSRSTIPIGSTWLELNPRKPNRVVTVIGIDQFSGKIQINHAGRVTRASINRFNGKVGGYTKIEVE